MPSPSHFHHGSPSVAAWDTLHSEAAEALSPSVFLSPFLSRVICELIFLNSAHQTRIPSPLPWIITGEQSGCSKAGKMHLNDPAATAICCPSQRDDPWLQNSHEYLAPGSLLTCTLTSHPYRGTESHVLLLLDSWKWIPGEIISSNAQGQIEGRSTGLTT